MLCGEDPVTGRDLSHRRGWIEDRLLELTEIFTVHIYAHAVMSNHYHATADYRPQERLEFTDEEVARRWLRLFPPQHDEEIEQAVTTLLNDPERLAVLRDRLGDLSWFMRCLNEPIARRANREDDCTGRFWQGRFCSKALPSDRSVWACMAYDDLNPLRAGMAEEIDAPEHTSLQRRLEEAAEKPERLDEPLAPLVRRAGKVVSAPPPARRLDMTLRDLPRLRRVGWLAACTTRPAGKGRAPPGRLRDPTAWLALVASNRQRAPTTTLSRWVRAAA